ncbi:MAG: hypothetical protein LC100_06235 [Chitinophagales bacterium]|nr:hypothetical protein [Chitinophagales bacterium]
MSEECKDCPYQIGNNSRIDKIEKDIDGIWGRLRAVETAVTSQTENTKMIFDILGELKLSVKSIEKALYEREDPFKLAMFNVGMWSLKVLVGGGALVWAISKFGGQL